MAASIDPYRLDADVQPPQEVNFVQLLIAIGEEKRLIACVTAFAVGVALLAAFLIAPIYTARTTLLPPQQGQGGASVLAGSLGALAATAGLTAALKTPEELYAGLLRTDLVSDGLIAAHKLQERYGEKTLYDSRRELLRNVRIITDRKSSLITLEVDDEDPAFAARLANAYAEELKKLLTRVEVTAAQQRRRFYEAQMTKIKDELIAAELAVKLAQDRGGVMSLDAQTQSSITSAEQMRAQIVAREVQLQAMRSYAGPQNPEYARIQAELVSLRRQLAKMEGLDSVPADTTAGSRQNVNDALTNIRAYRELKYQEAMYTALLQQFQLAKAEESKEAPLVQQIGTAMPPDKKSKPSRIVILFAGLLLGLFLGSVLAFTRRASRAARQDPEAAGKWLALSKAWSFRRS